MSAKKIISLLILFYPLIGFAQIDSTINLNEVHISSIRNEYSPAGIKSSKIDSIAKLTRSDQTLSDYLNDFTSFSVKNYGPGALSSVSLRGGSAYHTSVLWKGFPLANPMNGVMDFNLLPTFLFDDISIQYGGASSLWGSGAISGSIHLDDKSIYSTRNAIKVGSRYSSASGFVNFAEGYFNHKKLNSSVKVFYTNEKNEFNFRQNGELKKQVHAGSIGYGIISENTYQFNSGTSLNFNFWHQFAQRNIAPVLTESISDAMQRDRNFRYNLTFTKSGMKGRFVFRNAYFNESLYYNDDALTTPSNSLCKTYISEPEFSFRFNDHHSIQTGLNFTRVNAVTAEYNKVETVNRQSIFLAYHLLYGKFNFSASARQEFNEFHRPPLVYTVGFSYMPLEYIKLMASYSKVYRNPQVNDLFWQPGGNIALLPETGTSYEGTIDLNLLRLENKNYNDSNSFTLRTTAFNKSINNWIAWTPHGTLWTPGNIKAVHSYGTENTLTFIKQIRKFRIQMSGFYAYTISEATSSLLPFDASVNKQLIYVPIQKAGGNVTVSFKNFLLSFNHTFTDDRFTSTDNQELLPAYQKSSLQINKLIKLKNKDATIFFRVDNLFNTQYQSVLNHPEPLRNFAFGANFSFYQKSKINPH